MANNYAIPLGGSGGGNDNFKELVGSLGLPRHTLVRWDGSAWIASDLVTANANIDDGFLSCAIVLGDDANGNTILGFGGLVDVTTVIGSVHGLTIGQYYFEDPAGAMTTTTPATGWNNDVLKAVDANCLFIDFGRPFYADEKASTYSLVKPIQSVGHGFALLDQVYVDAGGWALGDVSDIAKIPTHTVVRVIDADTFCVQADGYALIAHGLATPTGTDYFATNSGATGNYTDNFTVALGNTTGNYNQSAFQVVDGSTLLILTGKRAYEIA